VAESVDRRQSSVQSGDGILRPAARRCQRR
jgi:hypothetical protein